MKKNLFLFASAALALTVATSCSNSDDVYNPDAVNQAKLAEYNQKFIAEFGTPAADQDWGFGSTSTKTRGVNAKGNEWYDTYEVDPAVTSEEIAGVYAFVNKDAGEVKTVDAISFSNYFVSQVYKGSKDVATETYSYMKDRNGSVKNEKVVGSSLMNLLAVKENADQSLGNYTHIYDFNGGNNTDYDGKMLLENSGTFDFSYYCSLGSYTSNRYIIVSGTDIFGATSQYASYYYVCFDFETNHPTKTFIGFQEGGGAFEINGYYTDEDALQKAIDNGEIANADEYKSTAKGAKLLGWANDNSTDMVAANNYYTDWIVRISPATKKGTTPTPTPEVTTSVRVFAEDLGTIGDWDFNDVVFDITSDNKVILQAAGGTLPLYLEWNKERKEVHEQFKVPTTTMVNTHASSNGEDGKTPVELWSNFNEDASAIKIYVVENGEEREIEARIGQPAAKFAVRKAIDWQVEGHNIIEKYKGFADYVQKKTEGWYLTEKDLNKK